MLARRLAALAVLAAIVAGGTLAAAQSAPRKADPMLITKGRYLVQIMSCGDCHTPGQSYGEPDSARAFAGSELGWKGPWGVRYAANLTPDLDTGIGYWTAAELATTLRTGKRPDGRAIGSPMPMANIMQLTPDDADAIAAFLLSLRPVRHEVPMALRPGVEAKGPVLEFPAPSAWDAPKVPPPAPAGENR
jgi:mono/diheme cytochrome c family protein